MARLVEINTCANSGAPGTIAENIALQASKKGWECEIAYGRGKRPSAFPLYRVGNDLDIYCHGIQSRLLDNHGLCSTQATKQFVRHLDEFKPDVVHLHNIHGYFINYQVLFDYLHRWGGPIVWTLHDCWPVTGHCSCFDTIACDKWKSLCHNCPQPQSYPTSYLLDRSKRNYEAKRDAFLSVASQIVLVPVSDWLNDIIGQSFLSHCRRTVIHNGIDVEIFRPYSHAQDDAKLILGVANRWSDRKGKGLADFYELAQRLPQGFRIVLVGLNDRQMRNLPPAIEGIKHTDSVAELAELYSKASVFVNPTWEDNFPTTNLEALACGTPVVTYRTGGSPEAIDQTTGIVVEKGDINGLAEAIETIVSSSDRYTTEQCRSRALRLYRREDRFREYVDLFEGLIG